MPRVWTEMDCSDVVATAAADSGHLFLGLSQQVAREGALAN